MNVWLLRVAGRNAASHNLPCPLPFVRLHNAGILRNKAPQMIPILVSGGSELLSGNRTKGGRGERRASGGVVMTVGMCEVKYTCGLSGPKLLGLSPGSVVRRE